MYFYVYIYIQHVFVYVYIYLYIHIFVCVVDFTHPNVHNLTPAEPWCFRVPNKATTFPMDRSSSCLAFLAIGVKHMVIVGDRPLEQQYELLVHQKIES